MLRNVTKRYRVMEAEPGMELARGLTTESCRFALNEGTVLTASLLERLASWGVEYIDVRVVEGAGESEGKKDGELRSSQQEELSNDYNDTVHSLRKAFEIARFAKHVPLADIQKVAETDIIQYMDTFSILNHLQVVERREDYTYCHAIDVAVLSGIIGRWLGYDEKIVKELVLAGLIHDIGKTQIPSEIVRKTGLLSELEMETMRHHTTRGYKLVKDFHLPHNVLLAILQHHERADGTGYPLKVTGDKIHLFARIVAIADVYNAMTSDKVYRAKTTPFHAADVIVHEMFDKLDPNICAVFVSNLKDYFVGNIVELDDGREAEVVYIGNMLAARPIVRTDAGEFIDMGKEKSVNIAKLVRT